MPLDGHAYLVSQGWAGIGSGLRHDSINRPVIVAQKKTLSGIGKDRDESFPFWDHVFNAAANAIKVKVYDSDFEDPDSSSTPIVLERTSTGIISNRRPGSRTPGTSGTVTPSEPFSSTSGSSLPKLSVMAAAKQAAARRMLYAKFFRGPILSSEFKEQTATEQAGSRVEEGTVQVTEELKEPRLTRKGDTKRKRKPEENVTEGKRRKREKKERQRESSEGTAQEVDMKKGRAGKKSRKEKEMSEAECNGSVTPLDDSVRASAIFTHTEAERTRLKEKKRARKEERRKRNTEKWAAVAEHEQCSSDVQSTEGAMVKKLEMNQSATFPQEGEGTRRKEREKRKEKRN